MPSRLIAILTALLVAPLTVFASTDGVYSLNRKSSKLWDGTAANRLVAATPNDYDYASFSSTASDDYGSGIFAGNSSPFLSLSEAFTPIYQLADTSYGFTTSFSTLHLIFTGTGSGTIITPPP